MKKVLAIILTFLLTASLAACGRKMDLPNTDTTILPETMPTIGTNIPDPEVDKKMPIYTEPDAGDLLDPSTDTGTDSRSRN